MVRLRRIMFRACLRWLLRTRGVDPSEVHFVTWRLADGQRALTFAERELVCHVLRRRDGQRHDLLAFVVMDDHAHVLVRLGGESIGRLLHAWKTASAWQMQRLHRRAQPVWQPGAIDCVLRSDEERRQKAEYIVGNPWKRWPFVPGYPWVWEAVEEGDWVR